MFALFFLINVTFISSLQANGKCFVLDRIGLFVLVEVCAAMGLLQAIGNALAAVIKSQPEENQLAIAITLILWVSAITSAFLDNIPYTATMIPVVTILANELPETLDVKTLAWALSFGACCKLSESFFSVQTFPTLCHLRR